MLFRSFDESMSAFKPKTTPTGNLPHLSYVERKPKHVGTELKNYCCSKTGIMICLQIVRGRSDRTLCPHDDIKTHTAAVSVRLAELSKRDNHDGNEDLDKEQKE